jgi:hypothetical protein
MSFRERTSRGRASHGRGYFTGRASVSLMSTYLVDMPLTSMQLTGYPSLTGGSVMGSVMGSVSRGGRISYESVPHMVCISHRRASHWQLVICHILTFPQCLWSQDTWYVSSSCKQ